MAIRNDKVTPESGLAFVACCRSLCWVVVRDILDTSWNFQTNHRAKNPAINLRALALSEISKYPHPAVGKFTLHTHSRKEFLLPNSVLQRYQLLTAARDTGFPAPLGPGPDQWGAGQQHAALRRCVETVAVVRNDILGGAPARPDQS